MTALSASIGALLVLLVCIAPVAIAQQTAQESAEEEPASVEEASQEETEGDAAAEEPAGPPPLPPPPDGILPLSALATLSYAPRDRPLPEFFGDTLVVVTSSGAVDAYDAATGEFAWKLGLPGESLLRPTSLRLSNAAHQVLVASTSGHLVVLDLASGQIVEERQLDFGLAVPPLATSSQIVFATPEGDVVGYEWASGQERFRTATGEPVAALAAFADVVVVSGAEYTLTALDAPDGRVLWTFRGRGPFRAPATIGPNRRVYAGDDMGEFYSLDVESGKVKYRWSTGGAIRSSPYLEVDRVYVVTLGNNLYAYEAGGGDELWRSALPGRPISTPLRVEGRFVIATHDGVLVEVVPQSGRAEKTWAAPGELSSAPTLSLEPRPLVPEVIASIPASSEGDDGNGAPVPATRWFERSRVALALRNGDVLLLRHGAPAEPANAAPEGPEVEDPTAGETEETGEEEEEDEEREADPPRPPPPPR